MFRWVRRLWCRHNGAMLHVGSGVVGGVSFELWRCQACGADVFVTDR